METRLLESLNRFTAYTIHSIELKLGRLILDINLLNRYEQDISGTREVPSMSKFFTDVICTCSFESPKQKSLSSRSER